MRMGPLAMADLVGLDLGIQAWKKAGTYDPEHNPTHALVHAGRKGQKTKAGWYDYVDSRKGQPSTVSLHVVRSTRATTIL